MSTSSLSINPALSPLFSASASSCSSSYKVSGFYRETKPISIICGKARSLECNLLKSSRRLRIFKSRQRLFIAATNRDKMTLTEYREEEEEENPPPLLESEMNSRPRRIALFVEPYPFA